MALRPSPSAAQDAMATIEVVNRYTGDPAWDKPVLIYPVTASGLRAEEPIYNGTDSTISIEPGCWVVTSPNWPFPRIYIAVDTSRPYFSPPGGSGTHQMHFVCLEPGETYVFDNEISSGLGGRRPSFAYIVVDPAGEPLDGVTVNILDVSGVPQTRQLGPDGRGSESVFANNFTLVSIEHPDYTFESELIGRVVGGADQGLVTFVGIPNGAEPDPATVTFELAPVAGADDVRTEIRVSRDGDQGSRLRAFEMPGDYTAELGAGCYDVELFAYRGDVMFAEVDRAVRRYSFCLAEGEDRTINPGDLVLANVSGDAPFIPIDVDDEFGVPLPGVSATFFYPRADLSPDDLRNVDHLNEDARGVFYDSVTTGTDGKALMPNYTECMVATLQAPEGFAFPTGEWFQSTVCEGESITAVASGGEGPPPDPTTSIGGRVIDASRAPVGGVTVDLFNSNQEAERLDYLRSSATTDDGWFVFELENAGCYVVTFIAPTGSQFNNGTQWLNQHRCVDEGDRLNDILVPLASDGPEPALVSAFVFEGPARLVEVNGVAVDLFFAAGDGSRGEWIEQVETGPGYEFEIDSGCYVLTFIAPTGRTFIDSGTQWVNRSFCIEAGSQRQYEANLAL